MSMKDELWSKIKREIFEILIYGCLGLDRLQSPITTFSAQLGVVVVFLYLFNLDAGYMCDIWQRGDILGKHIS